MAGYVNDWRQGAGHARRGSTGRVASRCDEMVYSAKEFKVREDASWVCMKSAVCIESFLGEKGGVRTEASWMDVEA